MNKTNAEGDPTVDFTFRDQLRIAKDVIYFFLSTNVKILNVAIGTKPALIVVKGHHAAAVSARPPRRIQRKARAHRRL